MSALTRRAVTKLQRKAEATGAAAAAIRREANRIRDLGGAIGGTGRARRVTTAMNTEATALRGLLDQLTLLSLLVRTDLQALADNWRADHENLRDGLAALYKSLVKIAYYRADIMPGSTIAIECREVGVDAVLNDLPASVQLAMYNSLDNALAAELQLPNADAIRNAIPNIAHVVVAADETVTLPHGYNVGADGLPAGGNAALVPVPPAFRGQNP